MMFLSRVVVASLASFLLTECLAASQKPLGPGPKTESPSVSGGPGRGLNFSSPGPHLFASAYGLLQQLSNTAFPNGHTMAAVEIPALTLMYHGRMDEETAPSPEWLAFDIEMAYGIMGSTRQSFMHTYQTTRPVKALYFDGESATLMGLGQLDTQMLHLYGNVSGPDDGGGVWRGLQPEYDRATGLCDWLLEKGLRGPRGRVEGVVRMNTGFELIWCDFGSESLRLVSRSNVTAPQVRERKGTTGGAEAEGEGTRYDAGQRRRRPSSSSSVYPLPPQPTRTDRPVSPTNPAVPPNWRGIMGPVEREPFLQSQGWGWFASATWHYGSSGMGPGRGETRAKVLGCAITSWYSGGFWGSMAGEERERLNLTEGGHWTGAGDGGDRDVAMAQLGRRRRLHHLEGATRTQAERMRNETGAMLRDVLEGNEACSGMEWVGAMGEIVQRTAAHLMTLERAARFEGDGANATAVEEWLYGLRGQGHMFVVSFLEYPHEIDAGTWDVNGQLFAETYSRCRYRYTRLLVGAPLSRRESDLRDAVEEVMGGICGVLLEVGFEVERAWFALEEGASSEELTRLGKRWEDGVRMLRAWVGWEGEFIRCERVCEWDERCYIPMWPMLRSFGRPRPRPRPPPPGNGDGNGTEPRPPPPPYRGRGPGYGGNHTRPGFPGRSPMWMGDDADLWEPKCVKIEDVMPRVREEGV